MRNPRFALRIVFFINLMAIFSLSYAAEGLSGDISTMRKNAIEYASSGNFREAENEFRNVLSIEKEEQFSVTALKVLDDLKTGAIEGEYAVLLFKGFNDLQNGSPQDAAVTLQKAIAINPKYARAYNVLGTVYVALDKPDAAAASFKSAIEANPNYGEAYYNLAAFYQAQGQLQEAISCYSKAAETGMNAVEVGINLGASYAALGKYKEAIAAYEKAIKTTGNNAKLHYELGLSYLMSDQYFKSREHLVKAKELYLKEGNKDGVQAVEKYLSKFTALEEKWRSKQ